MIESQQEYETKKAKAAGFQETLEHWGSSSPSDARIDPELLELERSSVRSLLDEMVWDLEEYEGRQAGRRRIIELKGIEGLPLVLVRAREELKLSHLELAERVGLSEKQVQELEAGGYAEASLACIQALMRALEVRVEQRIFFPAEPAASLQDLMRWPTESVEGSVPSKQPS